MRGMAISHLRMPFRKPDLSRPSGPFKRRLVVAAADPTGTPPGVAAMRASMFASAVFVLVVCGLGRTGDPTGKKEATMDGTWQLVEGVIAGNPFPPEVVKGIKLTRTGDKYVVTAESKDEGTVKYIPNTSPAAMEITGTAGPNKGKTFPAIYELHGDTLKVCYDLSGKARPTEFKSKPGTQLFLATYKRVKP
jgi:uncharacterized protein (TIGR03067 family)